MSDVRKRLETKSIDARIARRVIIPHPRAAPGLPETRKRPEFTRTGVITSFSRLIPFVIDTGDNQKPPKHSDPKTIKAGPPERIGNTNYQPGSGFQY